MEHLIGGRLPRQLLDHYKPEWGLAEAFEALGGAKEPLERMAARIAWAMRLSKRVHSFWFFSQLPH